MNAIFLDVDGVLNSTAFDHYCVDNGFKNWWQYGLLDQACVMRLKKLVEKTKAFIVICSSWRFDGHHIESLERQLELYDMHIYGATNTEATMGRGQQIMEWIYNHENIDNYVVIDDDNDSRDYPPGLEVTEHLVVPYYKEGFSDDDCARALKILTGQG